MKGRHSCHKPKTDPTYSEQWSGVSFAPHCKGHCADCGTQLHHESDSHYCPSCDDYKPRPADCTKKHSQALKFEEIPSWAIDTSERNRYTVAAAVELAGLMGKCIRLTAASQRELLGVAMFGKCKMIFGTDGVRVIRSVCFGTDFSETVLDWAALERYMASGQKPVV